MVVVRRGGARHNLVAASILARLRCARPHLVCTSSRIVDTVLDSTQERGMLCVYDEEGRNANTCKTV